LQSHAYAQGTDIHLASGQEKHLPHEAWHVVQQKQGRVKPTLQMKGAVNINDDAGLEKEADVMGAKAASQSFKETDTSTKSIQRKADVIQLAISYKGYFSGDEESWVTWTNSWKSANLGKKWNTIQTLDQKVSNRIEKLQLEGNFTADILTRAENRYEKLQTEVVPRSEANSTIQSYQIINLLLKQVEASADYQNARRAYNAIENSEAKQNIKNDLLTIAKESDWDSTIVEQICNITTSKENVEYLYELAGGRMKTILERGKANQFSNIRDLSRKALFETGSVKDFVATQAQYQAKLAAFMSLPEIMDFHQSTGFEFEFATFEGGDLGAHVLLAKSSNLSSLFNLPFELETDSGNELEMGFPPFLIPNKDGKPNKTAIANIWKKMRAEMASIRKNSIGPEKDINTLKSAIASAGLGTGWAFTGDKHNGLKVAANRTKHSRTKDQVYSQMNIPLTAEESAKHLEELGKGNKLATNNEKIRLLPIHKKVSELMLKHKIETLGNEALTHLTKSVTGLFAVPSIMMESHPEMTSGALDVDPLDKNANSFDLSSTIKELNGIWIKDSLPNILRAIGRDKLEEAANVLKAAQTDIEAYIKTTVEDGTKVLKDSMAKDVYKHDFKEINDLTEKMNTVSKFGRDWFEKADWKEHTNFIKGLKDIKKEAAKVRPVNGNLFQLLYVDVSKIDSLITEFGNYKEGKRKADELWEDEDVSLKKYEKIIGDLTAQNVITANYAKKLTEGMVLRTKEELTATIALLETEFGKDKFLDKPVSTFEHESFGTGAGVRKDTYVSTIETTKNGAKNLAELRGDQVIDHYLKN
jgi:hypothetical protein